MSTADCLLLYHLNAISHQRFSQLTVDDLPEVPTSEEQEEKLDLPEVPSKKPVAADAIEEDAETISSDAPTKRRGSFLFHSPLSPKMEKNGFPFTSSRFIIP